MKLAYIVTHPIQYQVPLLRLVAATRGIELKVFFLSDLSLHTHHEAAFGQSFKWDVNLTDGYAWELLPRLGMGTSTPLRPWWPVRGLQRRLAAGGFDAVWVHGWWHIGLRQAARAARVLGLPLILRGESTPTTSRATGWKQWLRHRHLRALFEQTGAFLCIGTRNREFYEQHSVPAGKLFHVPYAVDNQVFQARARAATPQREAFRRELGLAAGRPVILFAAKFIPIKAPGDLLAAYQQAWPAGTQAGPGQKPYLLFIGDGPLRGALAAQAGVSQGEDVRFLGFRNQTELPAFYDLADLFVLPSHFEPWGLVINEVMNAGKPVVVSACVGAAPDLVQPDVNGWIYPTGHVAALAGCLQQAFGPANLPVMGRRSLEIINGWDYQADVRGLQAALNRVAAGRSRAHGN
jgi:glycosyltransferase involved in cell wall biosynthesis